MYIIIMIMHYKWRKVGVDQMLISCSLNVLCLLKQRNNQPHEPNVV